MSPSAARPFLGLALVLLLVVPAMAAEQVEVKRLPFPEYNIGTACIERNRHFAPDKDCVLSEMMLRAAFRLRWPVLTQISLSLAVCIDLESHPDAAPASYEKLSQCLDGSVYSAE